MSIRHVHSKPLVSPADVEWVDSHGDALVAGRQVTRNDIRDLESRADRRDDGRLTVAAKQRIAGELAERIAERPYGRTRSCDG